MWEEKEGNGRKKLSSGNSISNIGIGFGHIHSILTRPSGDFRIKLTEKDRNFHSIDGRKRIVDFRAKSNFDNVVNEDHSRKYSQLGM
jgi:hypothetical protein